MLRLPDVGFPPAPGGRGACGSPNRLPRSPAVGAAARNVAATRAGCPRPRARLQSGPNGPARAAVGRPDSRASEGWAQTPASSAPPYRPGAARGVRCRPRDQPGSAKPATARRHGGAATHRKARKTWPVPARNRRWCRPGRGVGGRGFWPPGGSVGGWGGRNGPLRRNRTTNPRCRTQLRHSPPNSDRSRKASPAAEEPSRHGRRRAATPPMRGPIHSRAPSTSRDRRSAPIARNGNKPSRMARRKPTANRGRCKPNVPEYKAARRGRAARPEAGKCTRNPPFETTGRDRKGNRRTNRNRPPVDAGPRVCEAIPHPPELVSRRVPFPFHPAIAPSPPEPDGWRRCGNPQDRPEAA